MKCLVEIGLNIQHHCDADKTKAATEAYEERFVTPLVEESRSFMESSTCKLSENLEIKYHRLSNQASMLVFEDLLLVVILKSVLALEWNFCDFLVVLFYSRLKNLLFSYFLIFVIGSFSHYHIFYVKLIMFIGVFNLDISFVIRIVLNKISQLVKCIVFKLKMFNINMKS